MTQQNNDPKDLREIDRDDTGDSSAGSQAATTGYGTGQSQGAAPAQQGQQTPSNAGDAGFKPDEAARLGDARTEQMSHADGSNIDDDPDV